MKSVYFLVAAAALSMAACTSSDDANSGAQFAVEEASSNEVLLSVESPSMKSVRSNKSAGSKSSGTIGIDGIVTEDQVISYDSVSGLWYKVDNKWHGEKFYVYQVYKNTMVPTQLTYSGGQGNITNYENDPMLAPGSTQYPSISATSEGLSLRNDGETRYYPLQGSSDFWGYYIDDAYSTTPAVPTVRFDNNDKSKATKMMVDFVIDGSQDIMFGCTKDKNASTRDAFIAALPEGITEDNLYSAKAARANVQPTLVFSHQTQRITFSGTSDLKAYSKEADMIDEDSLYTGEKVLSEADYMRNSGTGDYIYCPNQDDPNKPAISRGVYIDKIEVQSLSTGTMTFAVTSGSQSTSYNSNSTKTFSLKQRANYTKESPEKREVKELRSCLVPTNEGKTARDSALIGEALLLAPAQKYNMKFYFHQFVPKYEDEYIAYMRRPVSEGGGGQSDFCQKYVRKDFAYPINTNDPAHPEKWLEVTLPEPPSHPTLVNGGYPGYSFNVALTINGLEKIIIKGDLNDWYSGGTYDKNLE